MFSAFGLFCFIENVFVKAMCVEVLRKNMFYNKKCIQTPLLAIQSKDFTFFEDKAYVPISYLTFFHVHAELS
jgi:hypothetical protein